ncbi:hypothetical protein NFI96_031397 [Prochilodus magdalenae]|nr:hypothetical protein NFI96_031397 [Prochilodus magdalenae]
MKMAQVIYENSIDSAEPYEDVDNDDQDVYEDFSGEHTGPQEPRKNQEQKSSGEDMEISRSSVFGLSCPIGGALTESDGTRNGYCKVAAVCLGLLCVLLLTTITAVSLHFSAERGQLLTRYTDLAIEKDHLLGSYQNLTTVKDHLETSYIGVIAERDTLQKKLQHLEKANQEGWRYFSSSLYYVSTEQKPWESGRQDCRERGADLVIINSREEQESRMVFQNNKPTEFVDSLCKHKNAEVFIGLTDRDTEGVWKWVDGSVLTTGYWESSQPDDGGWESTEDCVITGPGLWKRWNDKPCQKSYYWICEKGFPDVTEAD